MFVHIITLRFNVALEAFDDTPLQEFVKDKRLLSIRDHFFTRDEVPYLTLVLTYERREDPPLAAKPGKPADESWREMIQDGDVPLFNTLRNWRAESDKKHGIPPYIICTNRQLAEMVNLKPQSLSAFSRVNGFGKAKTEKYGRAILSLFREGVVINADENRTEDHSSDSAPPARVAEKEPDHVAEKGR